MVSKARLDLPEPESPVTTTSRSRGISSETFLRLCTRAPWTAIVVRGAGFGACFPIFSTAELDAIPWLPRVEECEFLHLDGARLRESDGRRGLADEPPVGEVLAGCGHAADAEIPLEVPFDLAPRAR